MRRIVALLLVVLAIGFTACGGGGGKDEPPPPTSSPLTDQSRMDAWSLARQARSSCAAAYTPAMTAVAVQASRGTSQMIAPPVNNSQCTNDVTTLAVLLSTMYADKGGLPYAQNFLIAQGSALVRAVEGNLKAQGITVTPEMLKAMAGPIVQYAAQLQRSLPGPVSSLAMSHASSIIK